MKYPKKYDPYDQIDGDVKKLIKQISKRFRSPGLNYTIVKKYFQEICWKEALHSADDNIKQASNNLGIDYMALYMFVKRKREKALKDINVG